MSTSDRIIILGREGEYVKRLLEAASPEEASLCEADRWGRLTHNYLFLDQ